MPQGSQGHRASRATQDSGETTDLQVSPETKEPQVCPDLRVTLESKVKQVPQVSLDPWDQWDLRD